MKKILLTSFILTLFTVSVQAAPISVVNIDGINVANMLLDSSSRAACTTEKISENCDFMNFEGALLNDLELTSTVTSNAANYTYASIAGNNASIDLGFNGFDIYNGEGNDLVIFIVGNGGSFGLDVFDTNGSTMSSASYSISDADAVFYDDGSYVCVSVNTCTDLDFALFAIFVDFGEGVAGDIAVGRMQLSLGDAAFSLAGGFYTEPTVVPLPLSVVLFSSGLALLGWTGRRKKA